MPPLSTITGDPMDYLDWEDSFLVVPISGHLRPDGRIWIGNGNIMTKLNRLFPEITIIIGDRIKQYGYHVQRFTYPVRIYTFPVRHAYNQDTDILLITRSAKEMVELANRESTETTILLPRIECGPGEMGWDFTKGWAKKFQNADRFTVILEDAKKRKV